MKIRSKTVLSCARAGFAAAILNCTAATALHAQYDICAQSAATLRQSRAEDVRQEVRRAQTQINEMEARATAARMEQEARARQAFRAETLEIAARRAARAREGIRGQAINAVTPFEQRSPARRLREELRSIREHWRAATDKERAEIRADSDRRLSTIRLAYSDAIENRRKARCD